MVDFGLPLHYFYREAVVSSSPILPRQRLCWVATTREATSKRLRPHAPIDVAMHQQKLSPFKTNQRGYRTPQALFAVYLHRSFTRLNTTKGISGIDQATTSLG